MMYRAMVMCPECGEERLLESNLVVDGDQFACECGDEFEIRINRLDDQYEIIPEYLEEYIEVTFS